MISKEEVKKIAKLARVGLVSGEVEKMQKEFSAILDYFNVLNNLDVSKVAVFGDARQSSAGNGVMREDEEVEKDNHEKLINLAPDEKKGFLKVKAIFK